MRLLFATTQAYLPQRVGGSQRSTHELSIGLVGRGNDVAVLCELGPTRRGIVHAGVAGGLVHAFLEQDMRTVLYFRDVQFGAIGSCVARHPKLRYLANSAFTAARAAGELGIDAPIVQPIVCRDTYRTCNDGRHVLFVNPVAKKGVKIALDLARENPDIPFVFLESWPMDSQQIATLAEAIAPLRNVTFRRMTLRMADEYAQARILLVPSVWEEAWGRVVTEAQLNGIPVIASAIGGLPESVGSGGVLIPPGSAVETWNAHLREMWGSDSQHGRYRQLAIEHSRRPDIESDRLLTRFLEAVSGW